jgi:hypothetical protein
VRVLDALKILEVATIDRKTHNIDTPQVREAFDLARPVLPAGVANYRLSRSLEAWRRFGPSGEGQQYNTALN